MTTLQIQTAIGQAMDRLDRRISLVSVVFFSLVLLEGLAWVLEWDHPLLEILARIMAACAGMGLGMIWAQRMMANALMERAEAQEGRP